MEFHPDTVPTSEQIRDTLADRIYHPYKKQIWAALVVLGVVVVSFLGARESRRAERNEMWDQYSLAIATPLGAAGGIDLGAAQTQINALDGVLRDYPQAEVTPFALKAKSEVQFVSKDYDGALATLGQLRSSFPDFAFFRIAAGEGTDQSLADRFETLVSKEKSWAEQTRYEHHYPDATVSRYALVETTEGSFKLGFYEDESPEHVAAFVERAKKGHYNGTQVYEVRRDTDGTPQLFAGGSAASRTESDPAEHDRDEPTDTIEPEDGRFRLRHLYRMVSAVVSRSGESATRFMVITDKDGLRRYDNENTPFAAVLDRDGGLETIDRIGVASTYNTSPETSTSRDVFRVRDHPYPYVMIDRVTIWLDEKLEEGHTWDTSHADRGEPEPAPSRPEPWMPDDLKKEDGGDESDGSDEGGEKDDDGGDSKDTDPKDGDSGNEEAKEADDDSAPPSTDEPK